ncbi:MAG TPA: argininosuccinate lyase [Actinomycetota bacterium]|nr:argininosuccinate lyase [Actinomycetota bacterium]
MTRLWGGRFEGEPAHDLLAFTESLSFDVALAPYDAEVLKAHVRALARANHITEHDAVGIARALDDIAAEITAGSFAFEATDEDIHTAIERALLSRLPDAGGRARAGLSRNDRVVTAFRLWLRAHGAAVVDDVLLLVDALCTLAERHRDDLLPGYTHLQRAQPVRLAHHLLAHCFALLRDAERFRDALARADASPLGAGALAGSTLNLDPAASAADLGFATLMPNSIDAVSARDFAAEFLAAAAICGVHCSRIGEELVLWTSAEFGFAELDDAYATGSSLMPQKKNPDVAELARGKSGRLIGNLTGLLATMKSLPLSYNRDLQEDKEPVFDAVRTLRLMLPALRGAIATLRFDTDAMERAASSGGVLATDLAEHLVRAGIPFRDAHEIVGRVVTRAVASGCDLGDMTLEEMRAVAPGIPDDVRSVLTARASVERRRAPGPSSASVDAQVAAVRAALSASR